MKGSPSLAIVFALSMAACAPEGPRVLGRLRSPAGAPVLEPAGIHRRAEELRDREVVVRGRVRKICPSVGCWMELEGGAGAIRVELLGFTIDPGRLGDGCRVEGKLVEKGGRWTVLAHGVAFDE